MCPGIQESCWSLQSPAERVIPVFPSLCEPVAVPVLVQMGRARSSLVPVLLLCCLGAGKQLVLLLPLPALPVWCPAEGAGPSLLLVTVSVRLGGVFPCDDGLALLLQARSVRPSPGAELLMVHAGSCISWLPHQATRRGWHNQDVPVLPVRRHTGS